MSTNNYIVKLKLRLDQAIADLEVERDTLRTANQRLEGEVARLTAAAKPDAELVRQCIAQELATWEGDFKGPVHTAMRCLQVRIDAKMASLKGEP